MRERAIATSVIWIALAACIDRMTAVLQGATSGAGQFGIAFLMFVLILAAMGGTLAIWTNATDKADQKQTQTEKAKRDQRDARIKRLMATMDDDELDALEQGRTGDDGEQVSLEALMRRRG